MEFGRVPRAIRKNRVKSWEIFDDGLHSLDKAKVDQLVKISKSRDVSYSIHGPICDLNLASLNSEISLLVVRRMERSLRNAALLGAKTWVLHPGTHGALSWVHPGEDWKVNRSNMERLHILGQKLGVEVAIENISAEYAILGRVKDFLRLYREWPQAPDMTLDVGHSHVKKQTEEYLEKLNGRIRHVHLHDNKGDVDTHLAVGSGTIRWRKFLKALLGTGFDGDLVIESVKSPFASLARVERILRSL